MTTQEAYEAIRRYFSKPGAVLAKRHGFMDDNGEYVDTACEYLTAEGRKCAVGCLIPRAMYTEEIENKDWGNAAVILRQTNKSMFDKVFGGIKSGFLASAQTVHDAEAESVADFVNLLDQVAADYGLAVTAEPAFTAPKHIEEA